MKPNVGKLDRIVRFLLGAALIVTGFLWAGGMLKWILIVAGIVLVFTAVIRFCLLYKIGNFHTCSKGENC